MAGPAAAAAVQQLVYIRRPIADIGSARGVAVEFKWVGADEWRVARRQAVFWLTIRNLV